MVWEGVEGKFISLSCSGAEEKDSRDINMRNYKKSKEIIEISLEDKVWIKLSKKAQVKKVHRVDKRLVKMKKDY